MVTKIVVHFGEGGMNTVTVWPDKGVRGVLFDDEKLRLPDVDKSDQRTKLDDRVEAVVNGHSRPFSEIVERLRVCYWVEDGPVEELICW